MTSILKVDTLQDASGTGTPYIKDAVLQVKTVEDKAFDVDGNEITLNMTNINNWVDPNAYVDKRLAEYPSIAEQLDDIYHNGVDAWKATIKAVKDKYPKE